MRRPSVGIVDLVARRRTRSPYARLMHANYASIMPQAVGVWAQELGCRVHYAVYTGFEDVERLLPPDIDVLFVSAFTPAAYLAYALAHLHRERGVVTVLGGPHARAYPADARRHFDYVVGFTDRTLIHDLLRDAAPQGGEGVALAAAGQPAVLPGVRERWPFVRQVLAMTRLVGSVAMIGSLGCPYRCSFCVDAEVAYQPLPYDQLREDLAFLRARLKWPVVGWHDPNFGVRFADYMAVIDDAVPPRSMRHVAECSLSLLGEPHLRELARRGFEGLTIGIESWFDFNDKARQGAEVGAGKVERVGAQVALVTRYVPYVQTNFVWGLDHDEGPAPFDLTRRFLALAPAAFPAHNLFTAYGDSAPLGTRLARDGRLLDVPFHAQDTSAIHNVRLRRYDAAEFYGLLADLARDCYSPRATARRLAANPHPLGRAARWMGVVRSLGSAWRTAHYARLRDRFARDPEFRAFAVGGERAPRRMFRAAVARELGPRLFARLPRDVAAYLA